MEKIRYAAIIRPAIPKIYMNKEFYKMLDKSNFEYSEVDNEIHAVSKDAVNIEELCEFIAARLEQALQMECTGATRYLTVECKTMCTGEMSESCFENISFFVSADRVQMLSTKDWIEEKSKELADSHEIEFF